MATLTKRDLVVAIGHETGLTQPQVFDVIQRVIDHITDALASGDKVELRNFVTFSVRPTKPRIVRNPGQPAISWVSPPRMIVRFDVGKLLQDRVALLPPPPTE